MRHFWTLHAILSHWRRRPFQLVTLAVGLAIATALWSGVQALNVQARQSYDAAATMLGGDGRASIRAAGGAMLAQTDYVALRRAGWSVSPVVEGDIRIGDRSIRLIGIDPVTLPADAGPLAATTAEEGEDELDATTLLAFLVPPSQALGSAALVRELGGVDARPVSGEGQLPPLRIVGSLAPETLVTDVAVAQRLLGVEGRLSRLVVLTAPEDAAAELARLTDGRARLDEADENGDLERLTDSFHLNLTAFGFLSFLVGLFIVHATIGLAFEQRRPMLRTLRACGVSARALMAVMLTELIVLASLAGLAGVVGGYLIAATLLPDVAASLRGLYGARVGGELALSPSWWAAGIAISVIGAVFAAGSSLLKAWRLPLFATAQPHAWARAQQATLRLQAAISLTLGLGAIVLYFFGNGLVAGFALMGAILLAAALALPALIAGILAFAERKVRRPLGRWALADARQQLGGLSLALMALLLALAVNIGVGTMVDSFRLTFTGWLDQRLAAELYVGGEDDAQAARIRSFLEKRRDVEAVLPVFEAETRYRDFPVEVFGFRAHPTYSRSWPLLARNEGVWESAAAGRAILISEQLARRFDIAVGDAIDLPTPAGVWRVQVGAIYSDYGNPRGQVMMAVDQLQSRFPDAARDRFAVRVRPEDVPGLMRDLRARFDLGPTQLVDQSALKAFSTRIFERTFAVTLALNVLTLIVAGVALVASLLTLATMRLPQLAPVWAIGVTRRQLSILELAKAVGLAVLTAAAAVPLGLLIAWVLMNVINVEAFGWRLPLYLFPWQWMQLAALAMLTAVMSAAWPAWQLKRMPPAALLKVFADER